MELLTVGAVKKHIKNVHFGFKPFTCPVCKKSIQQKSHLKTHIDKQHGGKKGILKKALANHAKKIKKNDNFENKRKADDELTCPICFKVYLSVETKERHLVTFHKQKPSENTMPSTPTTHVSIKYNIYSIPQKSKHSYYIAM